MPQILDLGEQGIHELPDDATPEEIQGIADSLSRPQKTVNPNRPKLEAEMRSLRSSRVLSDLTEKALGLGVESTTDVGRKLFNAPNTIINAGSAALGGPRLVNNFNGLDLSGSLDIPLSVAEQALGVAPGSFTQDQSPVAGVARSIEASVGGLTDPNVAVTLPVFGAAGPAAAVGRGLVTAEMAKGAYDAHKIANEVLADPNATGSEKGKAVADALTADLFTTGAAGQVIRPGPMLKVPGEDVLTGQQEALAALGGRPKRQLAIPVPRDPFLQPGIPELADAALREAQQRIVVPGQEGAALENLKRILEPPQVQPVSAITGGKETTPQLGRQPALKYQFRTPEEGLDSLKSAENIQLKKPDGTRRHEIFPNEDEKSPVWGIVEKLQQRDLKGAVEQLLGQPAEIQKKVVDAINGVGRSPVPLAAADRTIFNELWDKVYQDSLKKGDQNATLNRPQPGENPAEHPQADVGKLPTEAGSGDSAVEGGKVESKAPEVTRDSVLKMSADEFFNTAQQWSADAMSSESGVSPQIMAELAAKADPDIKKWSDAHDEAVKQYQAVKDEVKKDPSLMDDPSFQNRFVGAAQKIQFFSEGRDILTGAKEANAKTEKILKEKSGQPEKNVSESKPVNQPDKGEQEILDEIQKIKSATGPLTDSERMDLASLELAKEKRGKLSRLGQATFDNLSERSKTAEPKPLTETPKPEAKAAKFKMTFKEFLDAPREGELLDALRKLPRAEKSEAQKAADAALEKASAEVDANKLSWIYDKATPSKRQMVESAIAKLSKSKKKIVDAYEKALNESVKTSTGDRESRQRNIYDKAVEAGIIENPEGKVANPSDIISKIEDLQKKLRQGSEGGALQMGIPKAILDLGLEAARLTLKAGKSIGEAVEAAVRKIYDSLSKDERKDFDEEAVRKNINSILDQSKVESASSKPATPSGPVTLDDVYKRFEPNPTAKTPIKQKLTNAIESLRTGFSSKFRPLNKLAEDIADMYGRKSSKDVAGIFEQLSGSQGKAEADIYRFDQDVSKLVKGNERDFNAYLFLKRTLDRLNQDQADRAAGKPVRRAVSNYTIPEIQAKLSLLESNLGPDVLSKIQDASDQFQRHMDDALRLQVESGRMSTQMYQDIKNGNQFYAPFKLLKYIEETSLPEGSGKSIDTMADFTKKMEGIEDADFKLADMLASGRSSIAMSRILADKNMAMRHLAELSAFDTQGAFIKKLLPGQDAPLGMQAVNVLEHGKQERYAVNNDVAGAVQIYGGTGGGVISKALSAASIPFRAGATAFNIPFQVSNLLADVPRQALVSKYGINSVANLIRYPFSYIEAVYSSVMGDVFGHHTKLFQDFLDSGVAGTTIQQHLTPEAFKFKEPNNISRSKKLTESVLFSLPHFANAIEQSSKIVGVGNAMRTHGVSSGAELARVVPEAITELRRFSGSPDFGRTGSAVEAARLNLLYMFLNARIQGSVADIGRLSGRDGGKTAAATWAKIGLPIGMATTYLYYLNNRDEYKDDYAKRPDQEKKNYWLIPKDGFITTEDGEKIRDYWRIPKREISKWVANATESALDFAHEKDAKAASRFGQSMLQDISPVNIQGDNAKERLESVASALNPILKAPLELATGRDLYRHRDLIPDTMRKASPEEQYTTRTADAFKKLAVAMPDVAPEFMRSPIVIENLARNLTAGLLTQFLPRKPVEGRTALENQPLLQRFQALPYTDNEQFKEKMADLERAGADDLLKRHRIAVKAMEDNPKADLETLASKVPQDPAIIKHLADLYVAKQNGATAQDRQVIALPVKQRAQYVAEQLKGLSPENKNAKILDLARKRILTEAVVQELPGALQ